MDKLMHLQRHTTYIMCSGNKDRLWKKRSLAILKKHYKMFPWPYTFAIFLPQLVYNVDTQPLTIASGNPILFLFFVKF